MMKEFNSIKTYLTVYGNGNINVPLSGLSVKYYMQSDWCRYILNGSNDIIAIHHMTLMHL